ncbi:MAG: M23 family metallopeptidase, partial [Sphingomonadales bacterium]|nr:M23 family metallopeptidase [Sphingomonadales bacterium]
LSSAITQGVGVATGLQDKFDWAGVAAAGVAAGVGVIAGKAIGATPFKVDGKFDAKAFTVSNIAANALTGVARAIASAATRSLIEGTDFGENLGNSLPGEIGQTLGEVLAGGIALGENVSQDSAEVGDSKASQSHATGEAGGGDEVPIPRPVQDAMDAMLKKYSNVSLDDLPEGGYQIAFDIKYDRRDIAKKDGTVVNVGVATNWNYIHFDQNGRRIGSGIGANLNVEGEFTEVAKALRGESSSGPRADPSNLPARTVLSLSGGTIQSIGWQNPKNHGGSLAAKSAGLGWRVWVLAPDGRSRIGYGHLDPNSTSNLRVGQAIAAGDVIGQYGDPTTGHSSGPHVHVQRELVSPRRTIIDPGSTSPLAQPSHHTSVYGARDSAHPYAHQGTDWVDN